MRLEINDALYNSTLLNSSVDETERKIAGKKKDIVAYLVNEKVAKEVRINEYDLELLK